MILNTEQAAEALHTHRHRIGLLRRYGLLHAVKLGRGYGYSTQELVRFIKWAEGKDLGNEDQIRHWSKKKRSGEC